ncbi:hypothetical protein RhiJN_22602 [Ceratobasidium sp. AG-Ba]|nr:hypothetical protein RhiJN_22602 [Ceratobasidium sp. AG-Ba]
MHILNIIKRIARRSRQKSIQSGSENVYDPHNPDLRYASRNQYVFPAGFGTSDQSRVPPVEFSPQVLENLLVGESPIEDQAARIYVTSAEYHRVWDKSNHEFILLTVESADRPKFRNFLVLDRTFRGIRASKLGRGLASVTGSSSDAPKTADRFWIAYDGGLDKLLSHRGLSKHTMMERLEFHESSFRLCEMVALSRVVSDTRTNHLSMPLQSPWFTTLVWDCVRHQFPTATYTSNTRANHRGKTVDLFRQRVDFTELSEVSNRVNRELGSLRQRLVDVETVQLFYALSTSLALNTYHAGTARRLPESNPQ